jgi:predicted nucleotidyltransferase
MKRQPRVALSPHHRLTAELELKGLIDLFDRPEMVAVYLFGSWAKGKATPLSDIDLGYLGTDHEAEDRLFDPLYEALQNLLGEGNFDLIPLLHAPIHVQFQVAMEGTPLLIRNPIAVENFTARAIVRYLDFKPYRDAYFAAGA